VYNKAGFEIEVLHRFDITLATFECVAIDRCHAEITWLIAGADEIVDNQSEALPVIRTDKRRCRVERRVNVDQRDRFAELGQFVVMRLDTERPNDRTSNVHRLERFNRTFLKLRLAIGTQYKCQIPCLIRDPFDPPRQSHVERVGRIRNDKSQNVGAAAIEIDSENVRPEARLLDGRLDDFPSFLAHGSGVVEIFRDCGARQSYKCREVFHCLDRLVHRMYSFLQSLAHFKNRMPAKNLRRTFAIITENYADAIHLMIDLRPLLMVENLQHE
jgi:hypothetical protein